MFVRRTFWVSLGLVSGLGLGCDGGSEPTPPAPAPQVVLGRCTYTNPFSRGTECKDYTGSGWRSFLAEEDCAAVDPLGVEGVWEAGVRCEVPENLGRCLVDESEPRAYELVFEGSDAAACGTTSGGCRTFAGGRFVPSAVCEGDPPAPPAPAATVFKPPYLECREPLSSEAAGSGPNGDVCTRVLVSGCTEPGRRFSDYASCEDVATQRPYFAFPAQTNTSPDDPRLDDAGFVADLEWAAKQVNSCACNCCHSSSGLSRGASGWSVDAGPIWTDSLSDAGLAMMAGLVDSTAFGTYAPEDNNGFDRSTTGVPTTDVTRMRRFLLAELTRRGVSESDTSDWRPFGGPLYDQLVYEPEDCASDVGFSDDGALRWKGGAARYVYVLEADSANPTVPPNLDTPRGTIWRIDAPVQGEPLDATVRYGDVPSGWAQKIPASGAPRTLEAGQRYYLYVLRDVGVPITRCVFTR